MTWIEDSHFKGVFGFCQMCRSDTGGLGDDPVTQKQRAKEVGLPLPHNSAVGSQQLSVLPFSSIGTGSLRSA